VAVDEVSLGLLKGSVLDYEEDMASAGFVVKNPNATAKCGCGNSFSVAF
jgi:iron-sulfur cluster insertion protein